MSNQDHDAIEDAETLIDRFGGIRPMANKMDVPVTTVQGWKKRNVIPANRRDDVIAAARLHNVDISDILDIESVANENTEGDAQTQAPALAQAPVPAPAQEAALEPIAEPVSVTLTENLPEPAQKPEQAEEQTSDNVDALRESREGYVTMDELDQKLNALQKKNSSNNTVTAVAVLVIALGAVAAFFWPQFQSKEAPTDNARLNTIEQNVANVQSDVNAVQEEQSTLRGLIPSNLQNTITDLQAKANETQAALGSALQTAETLSNDLFSEDGANLKARVAKLEEYVQELSAGSPVLSSLLSRFSSLTQTAQGQEMLSSSVADLAAVLGSAQDSGAQGIDNILAGARAQSTNLNQTLEGVPQTDLKAAATLLALSQFRTSLNRGNESFTDDLQVLSNLVGKDDEAFQVALQKLAPHAQSGVLTPDGLSQEFRTIAGEVVIASLKGEDVSISEKAQARLGEVLQVEKEGELITGTQTQATVSKGQALIEEGEIAQAVTLLEQIDGPAAQALAPWLDKARASLLAEDVIGMSLGTLDLDSLQQGNLSGLAEQLLGSVPGRLIQDKETGVNILDRGGVYQAPRR